MTLLEGYEIIAKIIAEGLTQTSCQVDGILSRILSAQQVSDREVETFGWHNRYKPELLEKVGLTERDFALAYTSLAMRINLAYYTLETIDDIFP